MDIISSIFDRYIYAKFMFSFLGLIQIFNEIIKEGIARKKKKIVKPKDFRISSRIQDFIKDWS